MAESLSSASLASFGLTREPPRPVADREEGYEERFDSDTLFYDLFLSGDGRHIVAPCPPPLNCEAAVRAAVVRLGPSQPHLELSATFHETGGLIRIPLPERTTAPDRMRLTIGARTKTCTIQRSDHRRFAARRVLFTVSKNNPLAWIRDWATFHVRNHGVDAVLFYDNGSTDYARSDIEQTLHAVDGVEAVLVQSWDFPYGPARGTFDSAYCQVGAIAHARWRYCGDARAVLNLDIDELLVSDDGSSVFDRLKASGLPCLTFAGRWVTAVRRDQPADSLPANPGLAHADCLYSETDQQPVANKWVAIPRACDGTVEWNIHKINGLTGRAAQAARGKKPLVADMAYRHCRQIATNWKYRRSKIPTYDPKRHSRDDALARALERARQS